MKKIVRCCLLVIFGLVSCKKQPNACFTADKNKVEVNETVKFSGCATDFDKINWDFGDGSLGNGESSSHTYSNPGTYIVQMDAFSKKEKKVDRFALEVNVKIERFLTKIVLLQMPPTKPNNIAWDAIPDGTGPNPDIILKLAFASGVWGYSANVFTDVKPSDLPKIWNLEQNNILLSNQPWTIQLVDDDSFGAVSGELMKTFSLNPANTGLDGIIILNENGYLLELHYRI